MKNKLISIFCIIIFPLIILISSFSTLVYNDSWYLDHVVQIENHENHVYNILDYLQDKNVLIEFTQKDKLHMVDVKNLIDFTLYLNYFLVFLVLLAISYFLIIKNYNEIGNIFIFGSGLFFVFGALFYFVPFSWLFIKFHLVAFNNDLWILHPSESLLIRLFDQDFFKDFFYNVLFRSSLFSIFYLFIGFLINKNFK